ECVHSGALPELVVHPGQCLRRITLSPVRLPKQVRDFSAIIDDRRFKPPDRKPGFRKPDSIVPPRFPCPIRRRASPYPLKARGQFIDRCRWVSIDVKIYGRISEQREKGCCV